MPEAALWLRPLMLDAVLLFHATRYTSRAEEIEVSCTCPCALFVINLCCTLGKMQTLPFYSGFWQRVNVTVTGVSLICLNVLRNWKYLTYWKLKSLSMVFLPEAFWLCSTRYLPSSISLIPFGIVFQRIRLPCAGRRVTGNLLEFCWHALFLLFQGCESVYGSVSGLKSHLGTCTLVGSLPVLTIFYTNSLTVPVP